MRKKETEEGLNFFYLLLPVGWINICWDGGINHGSSWSFLFCKENHMKELERELKIEERKGKKESKRKKERREERGGFGRRGNEKQK